MAYTIKLEKFEGPLDLLLHLIQKAEVNIYDIPIAEITDQYLAYLYQMKEFQIDIASEFLVMAATLLEIKSKMLFPKQKDEKKLSSFEDWEEELDPRDELVRRLIEYRRFREVSEKLLELSLSRNQLYTRPAAGLHSLGLPDQDRGLSQQVSILELYIAFQSVWNKKRERDKITTVEKEEVSIEKRSDEILYHLYQSGGILSFHRLFSFYSSKSDVVISFLALLDLIKQGKVLCNQKKRFGEIEIIAKEGFPIHGSG